MDTLITWCSFLGAWLLVAGPVYQAAQDLHDGHDTRTVYVQAAHDVAPRAPVSRWWWVLPPVHWWLRRRRSQAHRRAVLATLARDQLEPVLALVAKADGWLYVGLGGLLLAVGETWELVEFEDWPAGVFVPIAVVMLVLATLNTTWRVTRHRRLVAARTETP